MKADAIKYLITFRSILPPEVRILNECLLLNLCILIEYIMENVFERTTTVPNILNVSEMWKSLLSI